MDFCVMCGRTLPTECGSQVCRTCELTAGMNFMKFICPCCGKVMEIWYKEVTSYHKSYFNDFPSMEVDLIYHCDGCGCDWDSQCHYEYGNIEQTELKRHFWG